MVCASKDALRALFAVIQKILKIIAMLQMFSEQSIRQTLPT